MMLRYSLIQFCFWFLLGDLSNMASIYLLDRGLSNTGLGWLIAAACVGAIGLQTVVSAWADRDSSPSVRVILAFGAVLMAVLAVLVQATYPFPVVTIAIFALAIVAVQALPPFVNALGTESINRGEKIDYSFARGIGSVGYAVMSYSVGTLCDHFGPVVQPLTIFAAAVVLLISVLRFPFVKVPKTQSSAPQADGKPSSLQDSQPGFRDGHSASPERRSDSPVAFLGRYPQFAAVLAGCVFLYFGHCCINNFVLQIVREKGGDSGEMGIAMSIAAVLELPTMFFFTRLLRIRPAWFWVRISGIFFTVKVVVTLLAGNILSFYAAQVFQLAGWAVIMVASVYYVNDIMQEQDKIKGQAYMTMSYTVANVMGSITGGMLIDRFGVNGMLIAASVVSMAGTLIVYGAARGRGKER